MGSWAWPWPPSPSGRPPGSAPASPRSSPRPWLAARWCWRPRSCSATRCGPPRGRTRPAGAKGCGRHSSAGAARTSAVWPLLGARATIRRPHVATGVHEMAKAAVLTGIDEPLEIRDDVEVERPRAGEVKVRMAASGVCHSDLSMQNGTMMAPYPIILGHEGAGVIEEVGEGVTNLAPGDHVVISWVPQCGQCFFCQRDQGHLCEAANT